MSAHLRQDARDRRPFFVGHADVAGAVHTAEEIPCPSPAERLPILGVHRVVGDAPLPSAQLLPTPVAQADVVGWVGEGHASVGAIQVDGFGAQLCSIVRFRTGPSDTMGSEELAHVELVAAAI